MYVLYPPIEYQTYSYIIMSLYPPLESADGHRLQHIADVKYHLEKELDLRASLWKKYRRGFNIVERIDTALATASLVLAASGTGLLATITSDPIALCIQAGSIRRGMLCVGGKLIGRLNALKAKKQAHGKKHDQIRILAESKLNRIADHISTALVDDKISDEEFRLIVSEVEKYNDMKEEIHGRQKQGVDLSEAA